MSTSPLSTADQLREQIAQLQDALISANPGMPTMLRTIHAALRADPTNVTLLSPEEVGIVVSGLMKQTNTVIAAGIVKSTKKSGKNISVDDL